MGCDGIKSEKERMAFSSYAHDAFLLSSSVSESVNNYKEAFNSSKNKWLKIFLNCDDDWKKMRILQI